VIKVLTNVCDDSIEKQESIRPHSHLKNIHQRQNKNESRKFTKVKAKHSCYCRTKTTLRGNTC